MCQFLTPVLHISAESQSQLEIYIAMLLKWNKSINLSGYKTRGEIWERLIMDSFYLAEFMKLVFPENPESLLACDLGAGAGLPGIPLRILWQPGEYILIESRKKRAIFMENVLSRLRLPHTRVFGDRVEKFFSISKKASCILSRAFMPVEKLFSYCQPYLEKNGIIILMDNERVKEIPEEFLLLNEAAYKIAGSTRFFTAVKKI